MNFPEFSRCFPGVGHKSRPGRRAFTLVEVALALGVVAFSMMTILALLPVGLKSVRDSISETVCANIVQQIRGELQQISFNAGDAGSIGTLAGTLNYYTLEGIRIDSKPADSPYYEASFAVGEANAPGASVPSDAAQNVTVTVKYWPTASAPAALSTNIFSIFAARQTSN